MKIYKWYLVPSFIITLSVLLLAASEGQRNSQINSGNKYPSLVPEFKGTMEKFVSAEQYKKAYNLGLPINPYSKLGTFPIPKTLIAPQFGVKSQVENPIPIALYTPATSVRFAAGDILTVPESQRHYIRYLSLYNIPRKDRKRYAKIISFMVNSLGKRKQMYIPKFVGASDETVLRININDYEWKAEVWENFAKKGSGVRPTPEPYFHAFIQELEKSYTTKKVVKKVPVKKRVNTGYYDRFGNPNYETKTVYEEQTVDQKVEGDPILKRKFVDAPWLSADLIAALRIETKSESPIIRADWFLANVSVPPAYYDFLGLGNNLKDFQNLVFTDEKLAEKARSQYKAVVVTSSVARNNRTLTRSPTFTNGYYWSSHDTLNSVEDRQYVTNFLNEKFDATEDIGTLPNGLQAYFLANGEGARQDAAPTDIAIDNVAHDRTVRTGRSCIWCHVQGIIPLDDEIRSLTKKLQNRESVKLLVTKEEDAYKVLDLFGSNLDEQIVIDQNIYNKAVGRVNGLDSVSNANYFKEFYNNYAEFLLSREDIAREVGVAEADLHKYVKRSRDPVILGILKEPQRPVRRDQWERAFQGLMIIIWAEQNGIPVETPTFPFLLPKK